ncbi:MAG: peptidylprolyl isomerase [Pseudomonadota bacterium]
MSWLKDPLLYFLITGAVLFWVAGLFEGDDVSYAIEVSEADVQRLHDQWAMQMRRPPTTRELNGLVEQFIKEEIYYREAMRLGLDANDTIVRRRMVQKLTFLTEDIATAGPQDDAALAQYFEDNIEDYRVPERYSFSHRYFSVDRRQDAQGDATTALRDDSATGDPFMLQKSYALRSEREIADQFGSKFAEGVSALEPAEGWQGPIRSAYGWHTVKLTDKAASHVPPFNTLRERVIGDARAATRSAANDAYYEDLKARYDVTILLSPADQGDTQNDAADAAE